MEWQPLVFERPSEIMWHIFLFVIPSKRQRPQQQHVQEGVQPIPFYTSWFLAILWHFVFHGFLTSLMVKHLDNDMHPRCPVKCFKTILVTMLLITMQMLILSTWTHEKATIRAQWTPPFSIQFYDFVFGQSWVFILVLTFRSALLLWKIQLLQKNV